MVALPIFMLAYAYLAYPGILRALVVRRAKTVASMHEGWPLVSVSLPAYNEEATIAGALDALLSVDYPVDRLQILVTSDASDDRTDEIVRGYADRGVELLRLDERGGKTAAENAASGYLRGTIVINTDASIRLLPDAVKPLVSAFADPTVGVASGRDVSVGAEGTQAGAGETGYVGYEMWVRSLESRLGSIIGASGCLYATRRELHSIPVPENLSRDFAAVLKARVRGYRSLHVGDAVCLVPRTGSAGVEYRRKVRTIARGLGTLWHYRELLNPFRYGGFAMKLISHKLCRWLVPPLLAVGAIGIALLSTEHAWARGALALGAMGLVIALVVVRWPAGRGPLPRTIGLIGFAVAANIAVIAAWSKALREGGGSAVWEPTRREAVGVSDGHVTRRASASGESQ
jgi:cellulose synthase/poly-beta-1,6-N-acetylglucosamine synthase-like glycosyltransferase